MTNKQTGTSGLVEVTQADRDAAADGLSAQHDMFDDVAAECRGGEFDEHHLVQAFAKHRLASLSPVPVDEVSDAMIDAGLEAAQGYVRSKGHRAPNTDELTPDALVQMRSYVAAIVAAALTASRPSDDGWMPIETAPKDGSRVLLWARDWTAPACGIWARAWTVGYDLPPYLYVPTHWRPLPDPPAALSSLVGEKGE